MDLADFPAAVRQAADRPEAIDAVGRLYATLMAEVDRRRPLCVISGRCCRFEEYGHRLYVTTMEFAAFMKQVGKSPEVWKGTGCPFQAGKLCGVHPIRPMGCRLFFCDASSTDWQADQYEQFHAQLKRLHEELGIAYFYVEWRKGLISLGLASISP